MKAKGARGGPAIPRRAAALLTLLPAALALLPLGGCGERPAARPHIEEVDIDVRLGISDVFEDGRWTDLRVVLRNRGEDFRGALRVRGTGESVSDPTVYRMDLEVPGKGGAPREILVPVKPRGWESVRLALEAPGYSRTFSVRLPARSWARRGRILVVAERPRDFSPAVRELEPRWRRDLGEGDDARLVLTTVRPVDLLGRPEAYAPFGLVILDGVTLATAPEGSIGAIGRWVEGGGTLVAFPGAGWESALPGELTGILGVSGGDSTAAMPADLRRIVGEASARGTFREIVPSLRSMGLGSGIAYLHRHGAGRAVTFAFAPGGDPFPGPAAAPGIHGVLDDVAGMALTLEDGWIDRLEADVPRVLAFQAGVTIPSAAAVLLGLILYVGLGFVAPALVFRRRRREWTYAVILAAAALATLAIWRFGLLSGRLGTELYEFTVLRLHHDGEGAEATTFLGVISPRHATMEIEARGGATRPSSDALGGGALPSPLDASVLDPYRGSRSAPTLPDTTLEVGPEGGLRLAPFALYPNGLRLFRYDYRVTGGLPLAVRRKGTGFGGLEVDNRTDVPTVGFIQDGSAQATAPPVGPGRTVAMEPVGPWTNDERPWGIPSRDPGSLGSWAASACLSAASEARSEESEGGSATRGGRGDPRTASSRRVALAVAAPTFPEIRGAVLRQAVTVVVADVDP